MVTAEQEEGQTNQTAGHSFLVSEARDKETVNTTVNTHETRTEEPPDHPDTQHQNSVDASQPDLNTTPNNTPDNRNDLNNDGTNDVDEHEDDVTASVFELLAVDMNMNDTLSLEVNTEFEELEAKGTYEDDTGGRQEYAESRSLKFPQNAEEEEEVSSVRVIVLVPTVNCS